MVENKHPHPHLVDAVLFLESHDLPGHFVRDGVAVGRVVVQNNATAVGRDLAEAGANVSGQSDAYGGNGSGDGDTHVQSILMPKVPPSANWSQPLNV